MQDGAGAHPSLLQTAKHYPWPNPPWRGLSSRDVPIHLPRATSAHETLTTSDIHLGKFCLPLRSHHLEPDSGQRGFGLISLLSMGSFHLHSCLAVPELEEANTQLSHSKPTSKLEDLHGNPLKAVRTKGFKSVLGPALPGTTCPTWEKHSKHFTVSIFHSSSLVAGAVCLPCMHAGLLTEHVGLYGRVKPAIKDVLLYKISGMF